MPSIVLGVPVTSAVCLFHPGREAYVFVIAGHYPIHVSGELSHQCSVCLRSAHRGNLRLPDVTRCVPRPANYRHEVPGFGSAAVGSRLSVCEAQ